ncbi:MAG TPA: hypothetical protein VF021_08475 [Longimicrobiales bacterium]
MNEEMEKDWEEKLMEYARELPAEKAPGTLLEERTVRELRRRGLLRRKHSLPTAWLIGSVAASLALFATGVVVGQYLGTRNTVGAIAELQQKNDAGAAAAQVQQTGSAYVQALEALVSTAQQNPTRTQDTRQAREVALTALHAAANEVVRLAPNDPVVAKILQGIEQEKTQSQQRGGTTPKRQIVWF